MFSADFQNNCKKQKKFNYEKLKYLFHIISFWFWQNQFCYLLELKKWITIEFLNYKLCDGRNILLMNIQFSKKLNNY